MCSVPGCPGSRALGMAMDRPVAEEEVIPLHSRWLDLLPTDAVIPETHRTEWRTDAMTNRRRAAALGGPVGDVNGPPIVVVMMSPRTLRHRSRCTFRNPRHLR